MPVSSKKKPSKQLLASSSSSSGSLPKVGAAARKKKSQPATTTTAVAAAAAPATATTTGGRKKRPRKKAASSKSKSATQSLLSPDTFEVESSETIINSKKSDNGRSRNRKPTKNKAGKVQRNNKKEGDGKGRKAKRGKDSKQANVTPLVQATVEYVERMCLTAEERAKMRYYERDELEARIKFREDFKLRMQNIRNSMKRATRHQRKLLKARMKNIQATQELVMQANERSGGALVSSVYGSPGASPRQSPSASPRYSPNESPRGELGDISDNFLMAGEKRRPASRQREISRESQFFTKQPNTEAGNSLFKISQRKIKKRIPLVPEKVEEEIGEDFDEHLGSLQYLQNQEQQMLNEEQEKQDKQPYFVEYMAMTTEEKKSRLTWKKEYDKEQRRKIRAEEKRNRPLQQQPATPLLPEPSPEPISHVGKRVWDYSGVPRLPNTTARLEDNSSEESDDSDEDGETSDDDDDVSDAGYVRPERKNDPEILRSIFPRPSAVDRRTWAKYGMRFHRLPKEQQLRSLKREKQMFLLDNADKCYAKIEAGIHALEDYREKSGIKHIKRAADAMQGVMDHLIGLKLSAQNMNDDEMAEISGEYCGDVYAAKWDENEDQSESLEDVNEYLEQFVMGITEGLAEDPKKISFDHLSETLAAIKENVDGNGIKSSMGRRHMGLANLTATFALERQDLEKDAEKMQSRAKDLGIEIEHEDRLDAERATEIKKRYKTPYLSGKKEFKPKPVLCWVCKVQVHFKGPEGHLFTFCSECGSFNQNPKAKPLVKKKALKDPRIRRKRDELVKGVNEVIHKIGRATKSGTAVKKGVWCTFDRLQRLAAVPIKNDLGPGQYEIRKNERKIGHVPRIRTSMIARPEVLQRELKKQQRERQAKLAQANSKRSKSENKLLTRGGE